MPGDTKWPAEELGDPFPGLPPPHLPARQHIPGVICCDAAHQLTIENGEPLFEVKYED